MNQILFINEKNKVNYHQNINYSSNNKNTNYKNIFTLILIFSIIVFVIVIITYFYSTYIENNQKKLYSTLSNTYNISQLYATNSSDVLGENEALFNIIGIIKIDKIKISAPILSTISDELLKIAPCKFYGPNTVNTTGNLCVAAHNYDDSRFFSNISKLNINDEIQIFDTNGQLKLYKVFEKYETSISDTSCTLPLGNNTIEITLITCNNFTGNRIIVKAKSL